jgi:putative addiction module CopG family antidote
LAFAFVGVSGNTLNGGNANDPETQTLEDFIRRKVESGEFRSPNEVVSKGLRLLRCLEEEQEKLASLRRDIALGIEQADQGKVAVLDVKQTLHRIRGKV